MFVGYMLSLWAVLFSPAQPRPQQHNCWMGEGKAREHLFTTTCVDVRLSVDVLLKATGDAPIMKKKRWAVEGEKQVGWVAEFIRKYLKLDQNDSLALAVAVHLRVKDVIIHLPFICFHRFHGFVHILFWYYIFHWCAANEVREDE
ncbi:Autophagy protein 12-like [Portunus trituberculatus]|uniref:Autophagy protein 12-like n=1 Tax=Portunus trituberculatus TaxID=210409 RepID=A0A5B7F2X4_PORTR|nr:Autophagy protein 12-like [Portunus trituberculatus]